MHPDVAEHPAIMGHEFAGDIVKVGKAHQDKFKPGMKFTLQPALNYKGTMWSPGYSYEFFGGDATYCIIPAEVMELGCLLEYKGRAYYEASLAEPMSCSIGAFNAAYHTKMGVYHHDMGIKKGGKLAILAGAGPMGLGALTYALHRDVRPGMVVVTDINEDRLARAESLFPPKEVKEKDGIDLQLLGIGPNGHIGFNEPGEAFELETHCIDLAPTTIEANKRFFDGNENLVPKQAYTMGIKTIMQARKVLVVANGKAKAQAVKDAVTGPVTPACPGSILQLHPDCILVADEEALSLL